MCGWLNTVGFRVFGFLAIDGLELADDVALSDVVVVVVVVVIFGLTAVFELSFVICVALSVRLLFKVKLTVFLVVPLEVVIVEVARLGSRTVLAGSVGFLCVFNLGILL